MKNELILKEEIISQNIVFNNDIIGDVEVNFDKYSGMVFGKTIARIDAKIQAYTYENQIIYHVVNRPKFLDWLFRRERKIKIEIQMKDVFKIPEKDNCKRIYIPEIV